MERYKHHEQDASRSEVILRLNPDELVPTAEEVDHWRQCLTECQEEQQAHYCLGVLMSNLENVAKAIDRGDQRGATYSLRSGLAATAAYEELRAQWRAAYESREQAWRQTNVVNSTVPTGTEL